MSPRNSTKTKEPKAPKAKKEKAPKAPKEKKAKKSKKGSAEFDAAPRKPVAPPRKVPADVYTLTLLLSFLFFVGAVVMLYLDLASYK